jgi:hypothetical protein
LQQTIPTKLLGIVPPDHRQRLVFGISVRGDVLVDVQKDREQRLVGRQKQG